MAEASSKQSGIFAISGTQGLTRLVQTQDLKKRMSEWQCASPVPLAVVGMVTTEESKKNLRNWLFFEVKHGYQQSCLAQSDVPSDAVLCAVLQDHFAPQCIRGQWFAIDEATLIKMPFERTEASSSGLSAIREAVLIWEGVAYASWQVPSPLQFCASDYDGKCRGEVVGGHIIEWLVSHSKNDPEVVIQYVKELDMLKKITLAAGLSADKYGLNFDDQFFPWLIMQGQAIFQTILENPSILELMAGFHCGRSWVDEAWRQMAKQGLEFYKARGFKTMA